jgi:hypothetical protein
MSRFFQTQLSKSLKNNFENPNPFNYIAFGTIGCATAMGITMNDKQYDNFNFNERFIALTLWGISGAIFGAVSTPAAPIIIPIAGVSATISAIEHFNKKV